MGCGCGGSKWQAPAPANIKAGERAATVTPSSRTRELIPGGYWNGPKAKKKP